MISDIFAIFHVLKSSKTPLFAVVTGTKRSFFGNSLLFTFATFSKMARASSFLPLTRSHLTDSGTNLGFKSNSVNRHFIIFIICLLKMAFTLVKSAAILLVTSNRLFKLPMFSLSDFRAISLLFYCDITGARNKYVLN